MPMPGDGDLSDLPVDVFSTRSSDGEICRECRNSTYPARLRFLRPEPVALRKPARNGV
jgi:hypothetical protein